LLVYRAPGADGAPLGASTVESVRLGQRLYVHLLTARPHAGRFPAGELLAYDIVLDTSGTTLHLADLAGPDGRGRLGYGGLRLPGSLLQAPDSPLHVLHGSCRKLDGKGEDAFLSADELLAGSATDLARRPSALFLTGDQIYGDDVAPGLLGNVS